MNKNYRTSFGSPSPLGAFAQGNEYNFAVFAEHAEQLFLGIFNGKKKEPVEEFLLFQSGFIWHIAIDGLDPSFTYAFRAKGPRNEFLLYDETKWLADPYAKAIDSSFSWNHSSLSVQAPLPSKTISFDWQGIEAPLIPNEQLVIYEAHVRGFTNHPSSQIANKGTFLGLIEKIPHLKKLGINAIELMPLFEFDETHCKNINPKTHQKLPNYWGYNSLHFFVPMRRFATSDAIFEFKTMVRELHRHGLLVFLDVVYNHTGEGKEKDYFVHFRGLDNLVYYQMLPNGSYRDDTGCGHTVNANHPAMQSFILDSLRYWAGEMQVDGFRFDLCAALTRGENGEVLSHAPLIDAIQKDPLLCKKRLIAEAWDASGLYLLGHFAQKGPWLEWNGAYRDHVRRFIKGTDGSAGPFADALCGSQNLYGPSKTPLSSINFITSHDGYSLKDLVSYQEKHNLDNGEKNQDGSNQNDSWNCGIEGETQDPKIVELRERQMRNFFLALFLSQGIPMILMGDEYGHTRKGNNNPYVQDNEINWFLWDLLQEDKLAYISALIAFRKQHSCFHRSRFLSEKDISWHGIFPHQPDWSFSSRFVAFSMDAFYVAFNAHHDFLTLELPAGSWKTLIHTELSWKEQPLLQEIKNSPFLPPKITLRPYSSFLCIDENKNRLLY